MTSDKGKGVFYLLLGTLCLDTKLLTSVHVVGMTLMAAGLGWLAHDFLENGFDQFITTTVERSQGAMKFEKYFNKTPKMEKAFQNSFEAGLKDMGEYKAPTEESKDNEEGRATYVK